jgi:hypothetical protein
MSEKETRPSVEPLIEHSLPPTSKEIPMPPVKAPKAPTNSPPTKDGN